MEYVQGDKRDRSWFFAQMQQRKFDAVIDMISYTIEDAQLTLDAFGDRVMQYVFCSTAAAYQRPFQTLPVREDSEFLLDQQSFLYGYQKAQMERYLMTEHVKRRLAITILRPSLTYGIGCANVGVLRQNYGIVDRIRQGKPLIMFGDGWTPWQFTFAKDLDKAFVGALGNEKTYGQAYHATNSDLHYWRDLYLEFGKILGKQPHILCLPTEMLQLVTPTLFDHLHDEKQYPSVFDNTKIKRDIKEFQPEISLHDGLVQLLRWYEEEQHVIDLAKEALEDQLVQWHKEFRLTLQGKRFLES